MFCGFDYIQPDLSGKQEAVREKRADLLCLGRAGQSTKISRKEFSRDVLEFIYLRMYRDAVPEGVDEDEHIAYVKSVYNRVRKSVGEEVLLKPYEEL